MARYMPIALRVEGRPCVVVGGGPVAARRIAALVEAGAAVTVVAPEVCSAIRSLANRGDVAVVEAQYSAGHLAGALLVVAATDDDGVNSAVAADAHSAGILCNDAQTPDRGDFAMASALRRGDLLIGVTTGGSSPRLSRRICDELAARFGPEYEEYMALLAEVRAAAKERIADVAARRLALSALAEDDQVLRLLQSGRSDEARSRAFACISSSSD